MDEYGVNIIGDPPSVCHWRPLQDESPANDSLPMKFHPKRPCSWPCFFSFQWVSGLTRAQSIDWGRGTFTMGSLPGTPFTRDILKQNKLLFGPSQNLQCRGSFPHSLPIAPAGKESQNRTPTPTLPTGQGITRLSKLGKGRGPRVTSLFALPEVGADLRPLSFFTLV